MGSCPWIIVTAGQIFTDFITTITTITMYLVMTILATVVFTTGSATEPDRSRAVEGFLGQMEDKLTEPSSKIVGGVAAYEGQFPFIVSLKIYNFHRYLHFCGGSAISTSHIITAAHCVDDKSAQSVYVSIGDHNKNTKDSNEEIIQASQIFIHERFAVSNLENDIAIIKLRTPFQANTRRQVISRMPFKNYLQNNPQTLTVAGWGSLYINGPSPDILNFVNLPT